MQIGNLLNQTGDASSSMCSVREQLVSSFKSSKEYRHSFVEEKIRTALAAQIKAMREGREESGITQTAFAKMLGKSQSWVARLEDPNAPPPTLSTLLQVAYALDVDLEVRFAPFSELVDWLSGISHWVPGLSSETLAVDDFGHDDGLAGRPAEQAVGSDVLSPAGQERLISQIIPFSRQRQLPLGQLEALEGKNQEATVKNQGVASSYLLENLAGSSIQIVSSPEQSTGGLALCNGQR